MIYQFDEFRLDTTRFELHSAERVCDVEPMVFNLLCYFVAHTDQVFTRDQLIDAVWGGRIVSDSTVATCVKNARKALGDTGDVQRYVQTVRGRGYRFRADVHVQGEAPPNLASAAPERGPEPADPSMVILPFRCLSDELELQRIADSVPSRLSAILSRVPLLRLSAEGNQFVGKDLPPTARQVHEKIGVDFVVDGSIQTSDNHVEVIVELADAKSGFRLWTESFVLGEPLTASLAACVATIAAKLEPQLHRAMYSAVSTAGSTPTARQLFLRASGLLVMRGWSPDSFDEANEILSQSCELDPNFALAPALQSLLYGFGRRIGARNDIDDADEIARAKAQTALDLDSMDSTILGFTGCSLADTGDLERGEALLRNAIELNPSNAQAWVALGGVHIAQKRFEDAVEMLTTGVEMSPLDSRLSVWGALLAMARLLTGNVPEALAAANMACRHHDGTYMPRVALAAAHLCNEDEPAALRALSDARRIATGLTDGQIKALVGPQIAKALTSLEESGA